MLRSSCTHVALSHLLGRDVYAALRALGDHGALEDGPLQEHAVLPQRLVDGGHCALPGGLGGGEAVPARATEVRLDDGHQAGRLEEKKELRSHGLKC